MPEIPEFFLFRQYSKAVKEWFIKHCFLSRYPEDSNVLVVYATPERAFMKYMYPALNGKQVRPLISFHLSGYEYLTNENNLGFVKEYKYNENNNITKIIPAPYVYRLNYAVNIYTLLMSDADILMYQILTQATHNKAFAEIIDGQWAEFEAINPRDDTNLEPGDMQDRVIRYGLDFIVRRAYLPRPIDEVQGIKAFDISTEVG